MQPCCAIRTGCAGSAEHQPAGRHLQAVQYSQEVGAGAGVTEGVQDVKGMQRQQGRATRHRRRAQSDVERRLLRDLLLNLLRRLEVKVQQGPARGAKGQLQRSLLDCYIVQPASL